MINNLLQTDVWVNDEYRTHCSVCIQQFLPLRRRHHCRTCGEVVCGGCSSQHAIRLTDMNVQCETRVCTFCIIRATDASIKANEAALNETSVACPRLSTVCVMSLAAPPAVRRQKRNSPHCEDLNLMEGDMAQQRPQHVATEQSARLKVARHATLQIVQDDPTMNLLVGIVSRTLLCPGAFIGTMEDSVLWVKASVGLDDHVKNILSDNSVCLYTLMQDTTVIIEDTYAENPFIGGDKEIGSTFIRFFAGTPIRVQGHGIGVVCAFDTEPHSRTTDAMKCNLEAVAKIVSEVFEQRVAAENAQEIDRQGNFQQLETEANHHIDVLHSSRHKTNRHGPDVAHSSAYLPSQYAKNIPMAMDFFIQLQRSAWAELKIPSESSTNKTMRTFKLLDSKHQFTRSVMKIVADCYSIVSELLDYEDAHLYQYLFSRVSSRRKLSRQTWVDCVNLHPSFGIISAEQLQVVTHHREYPDGSNVIVAMIATAAIDVSECGLLFGFFIAPSDRNNELNSVNVSCITALSNENHPQYFNLSLELLRQLNEKISMPRFVRLPSEMGTSMTSSISQEKVLSDSDRRRIWKENQESKHDRNESRRSYVSSNTSATSSRGETSEQYVPAGNYAAQVSPYDFTHVTHLDTNEQLLLDLLEKTLSTQEILAERQHEMDSVITKHELQLKRISSAVSRVESMLRDVKVSKSRR